MTSVYRSLNSAMSAHCGKHYDNCTCVAVSNSNTNFDLKYEVSTQQIRKKTKLPRNFGVEKQKNVTSLAKGKV